VPTAILTLDKLKKKYEQMLKKYQKVRVEHKSGLEEGVYWENGYYMGMANILKRINKDLNKFNKEV
jgi:hypothetical protein